MSAHCLCATVRIEAPRAPCVHPSQLSLCCSSFQASLPGAGQAGRRCDDNHDTASLTLDTAGMQRFTSRVHNVKLSLASNAYRSV
eukprot:4104371-Amphidinium_carterae.1